jgi:hypothetical protein
MAVVRRAQQAQVTGTVIAPHAKRALVVELEPVLFGAALSPLVDESAAAAVAFVHGASHRGGDVASRW